MHALGLPAGASWTVSSFVYNATPGLTVSLSTGSVSLTQAQPDATITASVFASGISPGNVVQIDVINATAPVPVVIRDGPVRAYVMAPPAVVQVDGLFADWVGRDQTDSDPVPVKNPDVNILRSGAAVNASAVYFHVAVAGDLMAGRVPERFIRIAPGQGGNGSGGPPTPLPRRTGEDLLRAYVDLNSSDSVGFPFDGIYADYVLDVRGVAGRITARTLYAWTGTWSQVASPTVNLAKNSADIEGSVALGPITNYTRIVFVATDWSGNGDNSPFGGTPAASPPLPKLSGPTPLRDPGLVIDSGTNALTVSATSLANQPVVDGNCDTTLGEYSGANDASNGNLRFLVGRRSSTSYIFVCLEVTADGSDNAISDWGEVLFRQQPSDTSTTPQSFDRRFRATGGDSLSVFTQEKGDGSGWTPCLLSCNTANAGKGRLNNTVETYEFTIRFSDIWGTDTPSASQTAGFAIVAFNNVGSATYTWGADNVSENNPDSWGLLEIPEFPNMLFAAVGIIVVVGWIRRRRA